MITMQQRKERIEDILDERLGMIESGEVNTYYQTRDIANLTQALLNIVRIMKEDTYEYRQIENSSKESM